MVPTGSPDTAETTAARRRRARRIDTVLGEAHPKAHCALHHRNPFELLVATILSAQTTDERVNDVTPGLFERFPDPHAMADASSEALESCIRSLGFFRAKARSLRETATTLVAEHDGHVPGSMESLVALRGVGRKTANVVLGECFGVPGIPVDTHVRRLSQRMALTEHDTPDRIERDLMALLPSTAWILFSHRMIWHGRRVCTARRPACDGCPVRPHCPTGRV